ncbi:MAG: fibrobacter succinogenes major paralogous domain-containing protein [Saprospiraceae bacterium]|nr:fibrobacter succinogenes major paralogous domain-containing protein [Candidatus Defluviibacterium haderslevense]
MKQPASFFILLFATVLFLSCSTNSKAQEVQIGKQIWASKNLNVSKFRNGDSIPLISCHGDWIEAGKKKKPACCFYKFDNANEFKYGKLYNWFAVIDSRGLAPLGWKIPSYADTKELTDYLGGESIALRKIKSTNGWTDVINYEAIVAPNFEGPFKEYGNGTNESGFNALPGGFCNMLGESKFSGNISYWWTTIEGIRFEASFSSGFFVNVWNLKSLRRHGYYIRCIKD